MKDDVTDRQLLEFESRFYRHYGAKVSEIRDVFDCSDTRYFQRLREIVLAPAPELAVEFGPLINRCRRRMDLRQHQRAS